MSLYKKKYEILAFRGVICTLKRLYLKKKKPLHFQTKHVLYWYYKERIATKKSRKLKIRSLISKCWVMFI